MNAVFIVILCGLIIGLALFFLLRSLRRISKGECCEGCGDCPQRDSCSSKDATDH